MAEYGGGISIWRHRASVSLNNRQHQRAAALDMLYMSHQRVWAQSRFHRANISARSILSSVIDRGK
jgi:hypothetical protein